MKSEFIQFKTEPVYQMGRVGLYADAQKIGLSAYGLASSLKLSFGKNKKFFLGAGLDLGSGNDDLAAGDVKTLQTMYPTNHKHYGIMDLLSWSNAKNMYFFFGIKPSPF